MQVDKAVFCPLCERSVSLCFNITESDLISEDWFFCQCGGWFHKGLFDQKIFNIDYFKKFNEIREIKERIDYLIRLYAPLIEDGTYGRRFLDVGFTINEMMSKMKDRGWNCYGSEIIDKEVFENKFPIFSGDFEKYKINEKFDFIHLGHVFECFDSPRDAFTKVYFLTRDEGYILIRCVSPELIHTLGLKGFGHFQSNEKRFFIPMQWFKNMANLLNLDIICSVKNISKRMNIWNDYHLLLKKRTY